MKSLHATYGGGISSLELVDEPIPATGPGQVLLRLRANSLNFRELSVLRGNYALPVKPRMIMGADGAGEVVETGPGVASVKTGDRCIVSIFPKWIDGRIDYAYAPQLGGSLDGLMTEYAVVDEAALVKFPHHLSFEEAVTLPCAGVTAWNALSGARPLLPGDTVLTLGSGAVSLFAIQFAKLFGARVIATTSSDAKAEQLRAFGADETINYRTTPDWPAEVRRRTSGRGVDQVVETAGATLEKSIRCVALDGLVNFIGRLDSSDSTLDSNVLYRAAATVRVVFAGSRAQLAAACRALEVSGTRPLIDRSFAFEESIDAFSYFETRDAIGKVVIRHEGGE